MRTIATTAIGIALLLFGAVLAVLVISHSLWFHGRLPPDTLPTDAAQAEDVAFSIASDAGCGNFDSGFPESSPPAWVFECSIGDVAYGIYVYGGEEARAAGLAELRADGRPFVSKAYYAVTALRTETTKLDAFTATPPPASIMDPFR
jgi:hypothetical protein